MEFVFEHATMIAVIAVVVIILAILASGYVKAPPDTAFIISGFQKGQRILIGKAGIKLPFFERLDKLSLNRIVKRRAAGSDRCEDERRRADR